MHAQQNQVLLGVRVPLPLKEKMSQYCFSHGVKMSYFVTEAIRERLLEIAEDNEDIVLARERLKSAEFVSQKELRKRNSGRSRRA